MSEKVTKGIENSVKFSKLPSLIIEKSSNLPRHPSVEACFQPFGCFSSNRPFDPFNKLVHLLPIPPQEVDLTLFMFDKKRPKDPEPIKYRGDVKALEHLDFNRKGQVKFIVHGWGVNIENQPWMTVS